METEVHERYVKLRVGETMALGGLLGLLAMAIGMWCVLAYFVSAVLLGLFTAIYL